jgi:hypothetical protein
MLGIEGTVVALAWAISSGTVGPATAVEAEPSPEPTDDASTTLSTTRTTATTATTTATTTTATTTASTTTTAAPTPTPKRRSLREGAYHLDLRVQTDFPISVGARIAAELPYRLQLSTSLGGLPGGYVDVINAVVVAAGGYDDATAQVVRGALSSSLVWRTHVGWRPFKRRGFYFEAGYGLVTLGGDLTGEDVLVIATGGQAPSPPGMRHPLEYDVRSTLHMIDAELGWRWLVWHDRIVISAALGFAGTVASKTVIEPHSPSRLTDTAMLQSFAHEGEVYLDGIYTQYVMVPVATVGVGYRFF